MANELIIYGYIDGAAHYGNKEQFRLLQQRNCEWLKALPAHREYSEERTALITRSFFCWAETDETFLSQIVHFGGSYRCFDDDYWTKWLAAFEAILRGLYWFYAVLHIDGEVPTAIYEWEPTENAIHAMMDAEKPVTEWVFRGGSRKSLWENSPSGDKY